MSFGYSVGDFIAGANLTYRLIHALSETQGATIEYQEVLQELGSIQQTFLQVSQMKASSVLSQATINAASHIVISSLEIIGNFMDRTKVYQRRLSDGSRRSVVADSWRKVGWALFKKEELKCLRDSLHMKLTAVGVLLSTAQFHGQIPSGGQYQIGGPISPKFDDELEIAFIESPPVPPYTELNEAVSVHSGTHNSVKETNLSTVTCDPNPGEGGSHAALIAPSNDPGHGSIAHNSAQSVSSKPLPARGSSAAIMGLDERFVRLEKILIEQKEAEEKKVLAKREKAEKVAAEEKAMADKKKAEEGEARKKPIRFKDAIGRKFSFPFHLCSTWEGMEDLIRQAFLHVDVVGPHVAEGHYDLVGPNGEIILPQIWETMVEPEWTITMHMWPMPEPARVDDPSPVDSGSGNKTTATEDRQRPVSHKDNGTGEIVQAVDPHSTASQSEAGHMTNSQLSGQANSGRPWAGLMEYTPRIFSFFS